MLLAIVVLFATLTPGYAAPEVPCLTGGFTRVLTPAGGRYLNDHSLARGRDGLWHLFGIAHASGGSAFEEKSLLHATARSLFGPWTEHEDVVPAEARLGELVTWAPHVLETGPGAWTMFYWGEWLKPNALWRGIRRAESKDLFQWEKLEKTPDPSLRPPGGRDPFLLHVVSVGTEGGAHTLKDRWLLYSVGTDGGEHGRIVVTEAADLRDPRGWSEPRAVIEDPEPVFGWGNLESPFVLQRNGWFYLFLTRTGPNEPGDYLRELVFRSRDPERFEWKPIAQFSAHASEVVRENGQDYLTSAGWTSVIGEGNRGLKIAPLDWCTSN